MGQIRLGWDEGKRKRVTRYGLTNKDVVEKIAAVKREHELGIVTPGQRMTVEQFLDLDLEQDVINSVRESTAKSYADVCRLYITPSIGKKQLHELAAIDVQRMINRLIAKGLSPKTARYAHAVLRKALNQAMSWDLVSRNVAEKAKAPSVPQHEAKVLLPDEVIVFIKAARTHPLQLIFVVAVATGIREGEALALRWSDIDFERSTLTVRHSLTRINREFKLTEPKTKRSRRTIRPPSILVVELKEHRKRQMIERLAAGPVWEDHDLVFSTSTGRHVDRRNLLRMHHLVLKRAELQLIAFHDLRHSAASLLFALGLSAKEIQEQLGHITIGTTMDIYAQILPSMHERTSEMIAAILQGSATTQEEKA